MLTQTTKSNKRPIPYKLYRYFPLYLVEITNNIFWSSLDSLLTVYVFSYSVKKKFDAV